MGNLGVSGGNSGFSTMVVRGRHFRFEVFLREQRPECRSSMFFLLDLVTLQSVSGR